MKKNLAKFLAFAVVVFILASCNVTVNENDEKGKVPEKYKDFFQYPDGRKDPKGLLQINNTANSEVLLFTSDVSGANYIGTVPSLNSIKVKLPEQKFYTIVAVDKKLWEERGEQADRFSDLTYYSNTQPFSMSVRPSGMYGGGKWYINNNTNYWISFKKADQSGETFAVAAPNAKRVLIPVQLNTTYDYVPHFYRELKYQGQVIALAESDVISQADTVIVRETTPGQTFTTDIGNTNIPSSKIKPTVFFTNSSDKTVRAYSGNVQLGNGATPGGDDFALMAGDNFLFTGLTAGTKVNSINFASIAWSSRVYVSQDTTMENNKVYKITLNGRGGNPAADYSTTVSDEDAEEFFAN